MTRPFLRFAPPSGTPIELPSLPPKTTFGGPRSAEGRRITAYLAGIATLIAPWTEDRATAISLHLAVGLPAGTDLLVHHDLDNFLEPLATHLGGHRIARASATKQIAPASSLTIAPVVPAGDVHRDWHTATIDGPGLSRAGQRALGRALAGHASPLPWGPVELEVALRIGAERNAVAAWKPLIDSLVAILGRAPGRSEFDIEDGRIVALAIHQEIDRSLGHAVQARLWWRPAGPADSAGPALAYEVGAAEPATAS